LKYQDYFDTTTAEVHAKLYDALWPFHPANQHHLLTNDSEQVRDYQTQSSQARHRQELYGPLWIAVTLVIEFCILSHLVGAFKLESTIKQQTAAGYLFSQDDLQTKFANQSVARLFSICFLVVFLLLINPFVGYLVFKNKGAIEVTFTHLLQIYGYSLTVFIPLGLIHCFLFGLDRLRLILTVAACAVSMYYVYKETREFVVKYLEDDEGTMKGIKMFSLCSIAIYGMLFRFYFMG